MRALLLGLAATALLALPASAQIAAPDIAGVSVAQSDAMASNLIGLDIHNAANEDVGEIKDLVLDSSLKVKGLVLSVGGFLGLGDRYVVVPSDALNMRFDANAKKWIGTTALSRDQIKGLPAFTYEGKFDN
ncbi:PRC-barrel domain-containing protein [Ancylobacter sp. 6x-1]|uniref:PRC-barrel domain-containing protein n=1 Tax=Ancylobacter crimeensis TaxID=2579147 RepID=A0ABT0D789_9HYPH|nr:PRC-barrel domain-containing protein [Ancylobacter crimeensis]MCK0195820.1 PRC-barrel domain-containing protein [Ancylobacter crimeensis]